MSRLAARLHACIAFVSIDGWQAGGFRPPAMISAVITVRVRLGFEIPVGVELVLLGTSFPVETTYGIATIELPSLVWTTDDRPLATSPRSAILAVEQFGEWLGKAYDIHNWGQSWSWNPKARTGSMHVGAVVASVDLDEQFIERGKYLDGVGDPRGPVIRQLRIELSDWRQSFVEWVGLIAGQPVVPDLPATLNSAALDAPDSLLWTEDASGIVGLPNLQDDHVRIEVPDRHEFRGVIINELILKRLIGLTATRTEPSTQLTLLLRARIAIHRKEYRVAMIELGSAAELCLWNSFARTRQPTQDELDRWTLGTLVHRVHGPGAERDELVNLLVKPRNDAIHRALESDRPTVLAAFSLVRELVSSELSEPLPTPDAII